MLLQDNCIKNFEKELDTLLEQYLGDGELNRLNMKINPSKEGNDKITGMINDFYKNQLQTGNNNCRERIKIDRSITFSEKVLPPDNFYEFLLDLGQLCLSRGRFNLANELFKKVKRNGNKTVLDVDSLIILADVFSRRTNWQKSLRKIEDAESIYRELNNSIDLAKCENLLDSIYKERGGLAQAKDCFLSVLSIINPESDLELTANLNVNLGILDNMQGNTDDSIKHLTNALVIYNTLEDNRCIAETKHHIGMVYLESGAYKSSLEAFDEGINIAKQSVLMSTLCLIYLAKSQTLIAMDDIYNAVGFANKALDLSSTTDDELTSADIYRVKGIIERRRKNYNAAKIFLQNSLRIHTSIKNTLNVAETSFDSELLNDDVANEMEKADWPQKSLRYNLDIDATKEVTMIDELVKTNLN